MCQFENVIQEAADLHFQIIKLSHFQIEDVLKDVKVFI